jgi:hypothetical protein
MTNENSSRPTSVKRSQAGSNQSGAALATAILMMALLGAIAMTVLAVVRSETRVAGSDLKRTQTFYAAASGIEKMTADFSTLFSKTSRPTTGQLNNIANNPPVGLVAEGYTLNQSLVQDTATLASMRATQGIAAPAYPSAVLGSDSPFAGLNASVNPFTLTTTATGNDGTQVALTRQMNNYLIPIFQFGVFSDQDLEFWPYPPMTFNGRVHANGNIYFGGDITFLARVTTGSEAVRNKLRNNANNTNLVGGVYGSDPRWKLTPNAPASADVHMTQGSVTGGPFMPQPRLDGRGNFPDAPTGTDNVGWKAYSVIPFGGLLLSKSTGVLPLKLPLQLQQVNKQPLELIKRQMPDDSLPGFDALSESRYHTKAEIRILIDDENAGNGAANAAGIGNDPVTGLQKGVALSTFNPMKLDGGKALRVVTDAGGYSTPTDWFQGLPALGKFAETVRGVRDYKELPPMSAATANNNTGGANAATLVNYTANVAAGYPTSGLTGGIIPPGAGIKGRILIEIVPPPLADGTQPASLDVTREILSMGMTVGEPNAIVNLQRPEWAAFMQGGRERKGGNLYLNYFFDNSVTNRRALGDGEIGILTPVPFNPAGYMTSTTAANDNLLDDDPHAIGAPFAPTVMARDDEPFTVTINAAGAGTGNGTIPVVALTQPLPVGTLLDFGGAKWARLTVAAAVGATTLTVSPLATGVAAGDRAQLGLNKIVPINVYNVREGHIDEAAVATALYQRGITSVIDINMRNLARWVDGVYDATLLNGTNAVTANINGIDGYVVYISDRRGDRVKGERDFSGATIQTTNGTVDNEDVYNYNQADGAVPDPGEDVIDDGYDVNTAKNKKGSLQVDKCELPSPAAIPGQAPTGTVPAGVNAADFIAAITVADWNPAVPASMSSTVAPCTVAYSTANKYWFRRAVRVFNGENLQISGGAGKLSTTKGITIATENMAYIWGNFNTSGINTAPPLGISSLNDAAATYHYMPTATDTQVPSSIVSDAFFPLSKTWYDALPSVYPEGNDLRIADAGAASDTAAIAVGQETSVRAGIIAGSTLSSMIGAGVPAYYLDNLNGGVHNFPRFLETWTYGAREERWNYAGSFIVLFNSTQAVGPWSVLNNVVYAPPWRNWAFDVTFTDPNRLPPGTPQFQHVEPTGFRQIL